jgi:hypothetical protein
MYNAAALYTECWKHCNYLTQLAIGAANTSILHLFNGCARADLNRIRPVNP